MTMSAYAGQFPIEKMDTGFQDITIPGPRAMVHSPNHITEEYARAFLFGDSTELKIVENCKPKKISFLMQEEGCTWEDRLTYTEEGSVVTIVSHGAGHTPTTESYRLEIILILISMVLMAIAIGIVLVWGISAEAATFAFILAFVALISALAVAMLTTFAAFAFILGFVALVFVVLALAFFAANEDNGRFLIIVVIAFALMSVLLYVIA